MALSYNAQSRLINKSFIIDAHGQQDMWVGVRNPDQATCPSDPADCNGLLKWDDGEPLIVENFLYVYVDHGDVCVRFRGNLVLDDRPCTMSFNALCQSDCVNEGRVPFFSTGWIVKLMDFFRNFTKLKHKHNCL